MKKVTKELGTYALVEENERRELAAQLSQIGMEYPELVTARMLIEAGKPVHRFETENEGRDGVTYIVEKKEGFILLDESQKGVLGYLHVVPGKPKQAIGLRFNNSRPFYEAYTRTITPGPETSALKRLQRAQVFLETLAPVPGRLCSGDIIEDPRAEISWKRLEAEGLAKHHSSIGQNTYYFSRPGDI